MDRLLAIIRAEVQAASSLPPAGSLPLLGKAVLILIVCMFWGWVLARILQVVVHYA